MERSVNRVRAAAVASGLDITIEKMPESTRTALEAATACRCAIGQIVKSMIFEGGQTGTLKLLLVSGDHEVDLSQAARVFDEPLGRADPKRVRAQTGFAIGGVSPIGHKSAIQAWMDESLLNHTDVWAAAGAPNAVFRVSPVDLRTVTHALFRVA